METIEVKINTNVKSATNEMSLFRKEIQQLRGQLLKLEEGTDEYNKVLSELANKQFQLREMNENVRYSVTDLGEQFKTTTRIVSGLASGFSAAQGVLNLFGSESENLQQTMVKLQSAMALVQGLEGLEGLGKTLNQAKIQFAGIITPIKNFTKSLGAVKAGIAGIGIGVLIAALGALYSHVAKQIKQSKEAKQAIHDYNMSIAEGVANLSSNNIVRFKQLADEFGRIGDNAAAKQKFVSKYSNELGKLGISMKNVSDADNIFINNTDNYINALMNRAKAQAIQNKAIEEYEQFLIKKAELEEKIANPELTSGQKAIAAGIGMSAGDGNFTAAADQAAYRQEALKQNAEATKAELDKLEAETEKRLNEQFSNITKLQDSANQFLITSSDAVVKTVNNNLEIAYQSTTTILAKIREEIEINKAKMLDELSSEMDSEFNNDVKGLYGLADKNADRTIRGLEMTSEGSTAGLNPDEIYARNVEINNAIFQAEKERYDAKKALIEGELSDENITAERRMELQDMLYENEMALEEADIQRKRKNTKEEEKLEESKRKAKEATLSTASTVFKSMSSLLGEQTAAGKAMAVAGTLIDTYQSATSAYKAMAGIPYVGPALGVAAAAAAVASGLANVKNILSVDEKGETSANVGSTPQVSASVMPTEIFGQQLSDMTDIELNTAQTDTRVYVVESDITEKQNNIKTKVQESTF